MMQAAPEAFWNVNIGNVITIIVLLVSFWSAHIANRRRYDLESADRQDIKTKVNTLWDWFQRNVIKGDIRL